MLQILRLVFHVDLGAAIMFYRISALQLSLASHFVDGLLAQLACLREMDAGKHTAMFLRYEMLTRRILKKGSADRSVDCHQQRRHGLVNLDGHP